MSSKENQRIFEGENADYEINKGDMIFIPRNIYHKVVGITPRIIASVGFFELLNPHG